MSAIPIAPSAVAAAIDAHKVVRAAIDACNRGDEAAPDALYARELATWRAMLAAAAATMEDHRIRAAYVLDYCDAGWCFDEDDMAILLRSTAGAG